MNSNTTVADLMTTAVITLNQNEALSAADAEMKMAAIRHLPVVDDKNRLVGILSDRDLLRTFNRHGNKSLNVREIMTSEVVTIADSAPAYEAAALMLQHKISALPVVGDEGQLIGMVTETDFMRIAHEALGGEPWAL